MDNRPNVLILYCDQLNTKYIGAYGNKVIKTPNIDKLASKGTVFTNSYCNNPICTPSRISMLTSLYPSTHKYYGLYGKEPAKMYSMFQYFNELGYRTGALGKLHTPKFWIERQCDYVYDEFWDFPKYLEGAGLYEQNDNRFYPGVITGKPSKLPYEHSCEAVLTKLAKRFVKRDFEKNEQVKDGAPWFAWVSFARPHQPYTPSEPFASMYDKDTIELPPISENEKKDVLDQRSKISEERLRECVSSYMGVISQIDDSIGEFMDFLEESGELDNSVVVFTTDHGDYAGEHGLYSKYGGISYSAITKTPLMICDFRDPKHNICDSIIESVDIFPTLCDIISTEKPKSLQGISYIDTINGNEFKGRTSALTENIYRKSLATKDYRFVSNMPDEQDELYDIKNDPYELNNLIDVEEHKDLKEEMQREILQRVKAASRPRNSINGFWYDHNYDENDLMDMETNAEPNNQW